MSQTHTRQNAETGAAHDADRYAIRRVTTQIVWGAQGAGGRPLGVLAEVFDRARNEHVFLLVSESQLRAGRGRNQGEALRQVDAALAAIEQETAYRDPSPLYGPLSVLGRGPGH